MTTTSSTITSMDVDTAADEIDIKEEDALQEWYSRQLYVIDDISMKKMQKSNILIAGLNGLGIEVAKNTILAGVKSVTILDNQICTIKDMSSNFYIQTSDIENNRSRAQACIQPLSLLNPYVSVQLSTEKCLSLEFIANNANIIHVIVCIGYPLQEQILLNEMCHANGIAFISSEICGVFGQIFVDFGDNFECNDLNGEPIKQGMIAHISKGKPAVIQVHHESRHGLQDGDFVTFEEIEGMIELNECGPQCIKVLNPWSFEIEDTSQYTSNYAGNGLFFEIKQSAKLTFLTLKQLLSMPNVSIAKEIMCVSNDSTKCALIHHIFWQALHEFRVNRNGYPSPISMEDCTQVIQIMQQMDNDMIEMDGKMIDKFIALARCSSAIISPMAAFFGGIVAQEILKVCSHKFTPIQQFMYFDAFEALPNYNKEMWMKEFSPKNGRYDDYIAVFGNSIQQSIMDCNIFLVGTGAIGCEMLKNFALMGVGCTSSADTQMKNNNINECKNGGSIHVTDMDFIQTSNLHRQFLFRKQNVGQSKSLCASNAVLKMNSDLNIVSEQNCVNSESENIYVDDFWMNLTAIVIAVDNVEARLYIDAKCVNYKKPMLECGISGTKGSTQIIVPGITESYGSTRDPEEETFLLCTLKNFPNKIQHTIQWAKEDFEYCFYQTPTDINQYLSTNADQYYDSLAANELSSTVHRIHENLIEKRPLTYEQCIEWSRMKFEKDFSHRIQQLLYNFPSDFEPKNGQKFWTLPKKCPSPIIFDINDDLHLNYLLSASNLRAIVYGIDFQSWMKDQINIRQSLASTIDSMVIQSFSIDKNLQIAVNDKELEDMNNINDMDSEIANLKKILPSKEEFSGFCLESINFVADDDCNFHMQFITASSNLRARNYRIREETLLNTKQIAGKISPAIVTTAAAVAGLVCLELYKIVQKNEKHLEDYRSCFMNLALPMITMCEPVYCEPNMYVIRNSDGQNISYSMWDKIEICPDYENDNGLKANGYTLGHLMDYFESEWKMEVNIVMYERATIFAFYMSGNKVQERKKMALRDIVCLVTKKEIPKLRKMLNFEVNVEYIDNNYGDEEDPYMPTVCLYLQ